MVSSHCALHCIVLENVSGIQLHPVGFLAAGNTIPLVGCLSDPLPDIETLSLVCP